MYGYNEYWKYGYIYMSFSFSSLALTSRFLQTIIQRVNYFTRDKNAPEFTVLSLSSYNNFWPVKITGHCYSTLLDWNVCFFIYVTFVEYFIGYSKYCYIFIFLILRSLLPFQFIPFIQSPFIRPTNTPLFRLTILLLYS